MNAIVGWPNWFGVVAEDIERQRAFYRDVLGFREIAAGQTWVWFDLGWPTLFEVLQLDTSVPQYDARRYQAGFSTGDIHATYEVLTQRGVEAVTKPEGGPESAGWWAYFRDPEGNLFEISQRLGPPWPGDQNRPAGTQVVGSPDWVGVIVEDVERYARWATEVLGLQRIGGSDRFAWFDFGWPLMFEALVRRSDLRQYDTQRWQIAFQVGDVDRARETLVRRGAEPITEILGGRESGGAGCYFVDTEGNPFAIAQRFGPPWPERGD